MADQLSDGVYLGLPFDEYLAQRGAHGSTQKTKLHQQGEGYWWASEMNPFHKPEQSGAQLDGEAIHALLLEGLGAYTSRFVVAPDKRDYPNALYTTPQIKAAVLAAGVSSAGTSGWQKQEWADAAALHIPRAVVWDNLMADFDKVRGGRKVLDAETDFGIRAMWEAATSDSPETAEVREILGAAFEFPPMAEVSVFYHDSFGMRHRARFDKLLPTATVDLKSLGSWEGRPLVHMLDDHIKRYGYDIQAADYQVARRVAFDAVLDDEANLHGGTLEERAHFLAMARRDHRPSWAWLFFQKPDPKGRAPILLPLIDPWRGVYHLSGYRKRYKALATYRACMERFGPDKPWSRIMPLHHTSEAHEPHITLGHWGFDDEPAPGENEELPYD